MLILVYKTDYLLSLVFQSKANDLKASRCIVFGGDEKCVAISQSGNGIFGTLIILWSFVKGRGFP